MSKFSWNELRVAVSLYAFAFMGVLPHLKFRLRLSAALAATALLWLVAARAFAAEAIAGLPPGVRAMHAEGIENLFAVRTNLFSGSAPEGEAAFAALEKLGIKTIITVDGSKPDVELARKHGMRYVHLPHGYDGINAETQAKLVRAMETAGGPVFMHCHHGKHRGPAAVAVVCMADFGWTSAQAEAWLKAAGTATNYAGLYAVAKDFKKPDAATLRALPERLPEVAATSDLTEAMVEIDGRFDVLKAIRAAGYAAPKAHPDAAPANEAGILREHYREAQRLPDAAKHGEDFLKRLHAAETEAQTAEGLLREFAAKPTPEGRAQLDKAFDAMGKSCASCHKAYRDPSGIKAGK